MKIVAYVAWFCVRLPYDSERLHRTDDVLQRVLAEIVKCNLDPITDLVVSGSGQKNSAWFGYRLEPGCYVDAISKEARSVIDDVTNVDADPEQHFRSSLRIQHLHRVLYAQGGFHSSDGAWELCENPISGKINDSPAVCFDDRQHDCLDCLKLPNSPVFVRAHH